MQETEAVCSRRHFLKCIAGSGLLPGFAATGCSTIAIYSAQANDGRVILDRHQVTLKMGASKAILVRVAALRDAVILLHLENDSYIALSSSCSHLGCQVRPDGQFLICPCHQSTFDQSGQVLRGPAQKPLSRFRLNIGEEHIEILIDQESL